jgi:uncharacterized membrane protein YfcA
MSYFWMAAATLLSGALGSMGLGGGGVLIIYLTLGAGLSQRAAQGLNLLLFIPCAIIALFIYLRKGLIHRKTALLSAAFGLIGAVAGTFLSGIMDAGILRKIFAVMLLIIGLKELFGKSPNSAEK